MSFKKDFIWGAGTSSYQIEGAAFSDGKGLNIWDVFCKKDGVIKDNHNGNIACDHYNRYPEDVLIMKQIGLQAYRFSINWPRVLPDGIGQINQKGLDFYDKLVDELLKKGIEPYITLYHWDYPHELYLKGGWLNKDSSDWFAEYSRVIVDKLSDRVKHWITLNEPQSYICGGYESNIFAPGIKCSFKDTLIAAHNTLLAHGKAVNVIRQYSKQPATIMYAPAGVIFMPESDALEDQNAARKTTFSVPEFKLWNNAWWNDPVFLGRYPEDGLKLFEQYMPKIGLEDLKIISTPIDYIGLNIYSGELCKMNNKGLPERIKRHDGFDETAFKWNVEPEALYWGPRFFYERYHKPIIITENGLSNADWVSLDGKVHDPQRIDFMQRYLLQLQRAVCDGVSIDGYFHWSLMDNFEWAEGYHQRFGLVHVDFNTLKRTIKDSALWYKKIIESNGGYLGI